MTTSLTKGHFLFKPESKIKERIGINKRQTLTFSKCNYFHYYFETVEENINKIAKENHSQISERICDYLIKTLHEVKTRPFRIFPTIPTAAIISGINKDDHEFMYEQLKESVASQISIATILLNSRNSPNISACWKYIITTLYYRLELDDSDNDIKINRHTTDTLRAILSARGGGDNRETPLTLILVFEDFEAMSENVLNHIIQTLYEYVDEYPLAIVMNISIFINVIHQKLNWNASNNLEIMVFEPSSPHLLLNRILRDLLVEPIIPFMIGPNLLSWLLDHFSMFSMSINQFTHNFKVALYYHMKTRGFLEEKLYENLDTEFVYLNRTWLIEYMSQLQNKEAGKPSGKRKGTIKVMKTTSQGQQIYDWYDLSIGLTSALYEVLQVMGREIQLFAKDYHSIYILLLKGDLLADENFQGAMKYLGSTLKQGLLADCVNVCLNKLVRTLDKIQTDKEKSILAEIVNRLSDMKSNLESTEDSAVKSGDVVQSLKSLITDYFIPRNPVKHPLGHLAFCDLPENMALLVDPPMLNCVHGDLSKPKDSMGASIDKPSRPPICTVYKRLAECGKFVNLFDWFQSYQFCTGGDEVGETDLVQANFFSAVAELEFLGIIKPDKRKIDHVQKLTHGLIY